MPQLKVIITPSQALLILMDKYQNNPDTFTSLKKLYLNGITSPQEKNHLDQYLRDEALTRYEVSTLPNDINEDASRRYFETHLAYYTLIDSVDQLSESDLTAPVKFLRDKQDLTNETYRFAKIEEGADRKK